MNAPRIPRPRRPSDATPRATVFMPRDLLEWIEGIAKREDRSRNYIINRLLQQARKKTMSDITYKQAELLGAPPHQCDEDARECRCDARDETENGRHAPGDTRCPNVTNHSACSHDIAALEGEG